MIKPHIYKSFSVGGYICKVTDDKWLSSDMSNYDYASCFIIGRGNSFKMAYENWLAEIHKALQ